MSLWFVTGSQHLYGPETLRQVAENSAQIAAALGGALRREIVFKPVLTDPDGVRRLCLEADADDSCAGLILWMHTFSPAKMWINGLKGLRTPVCHLHTQFNRDLPWGSIDMDFMNLNQAAHGDREAAHLHARLGLKRTIVIGHWSDGRVLEELNAWGSIAEAWSDLQTTKIARFGDNMRQVSVTDGDKVEAERVFGFSTNGYGIGDLAAVMAEAADSDVDALCREYDEH
ncbi:MAG: L-arabinose isomerase, partial [Fimbriimonadaceae bacterium]|nr:L-arabinose isomerase [Fimbriimonadaceae bacterium]